MLFKSSFSENEIIEVVNLTASFIKTQRDTYFPKASPLHADHLEPFKPFFEEGTLNSTFFYYKEDGPIETPDFVRGLHQKGIEFSLDLLKAVTFNDVVVAYGKLERQVQFHELVHAVQYRKLGVKQFANKYVRGLFVRGSYEKIPLEANARMLDEAFVRDPHEPFSVEQEVQRWINENKF